MSALPLASAGLSMQLILCLSDLIDRVLCKKNSFISIFSFFSGFKHDVIECVDFTRIAASSRASDDVTN